MFVVLAVACDDCEEAGAAVAVLPVVVALLFLAEEAGNDAEITLLDDITVDSSVSGRSDGAMLESLDMGILGFSDILSSRTCCCRCRSWFCARSYASARSFVTIPKAE